MIHIAFCDVDESVNGLIERIESFTNIDSRYYKVEKFNNVDELIDSGIYFKAAFFNRASFEEIQLRVVEYFNKQRIDGIRAIVIYIDNPTPNKDADEIVAMMSPFLMSWLTMEFLTEDGLKSINVNDILYFEYVNRKVVIQLSDRQFIVKDKINNILAKVEPFNFTMAHKSFIVNLRNIKKIKNYAIFVGDMEVPLAQKRSATFRRIYAEYVYKHLKQNK